MAEKEVNAKVSESKKEKSFFDSNVPIYLAVLLIIVGLLLGGFIYSFMFPAKCPEIKECEECICNPEVKTVKVTLIYDEDCNLCVKGNTILEVLDERNVKYELKEVIASSDEGKALIEKYEVTSLPTALVNSEDMKSYPAVSRGLQDTGFEVKAGYYIVYEANLDPQDLRARFFLNQTCNDSEGKIKVVLFDSPYEDLSIKSNEEVDSVIRDFSDEVGFKYYYINSDKIIEVNEGNELTAKYLYCADSMGKFLEFENAIKRIYCGYTDLNHLDAISFDPDLAKCGTPANAHLHYSLKEGELVRAALAAGLDQNALEQCAVNFTPALKPLNSDEFAALNLKRTITNSSGEKFWMPLALVGCKYLVPATEMKSALCELNPELTACKETETDVVPVEEIQEADNSAESNGA
ncbi:MAG: hypothetical protein JW703_02595 [Candidatus Diapherotrites archaeon]|nr:hypothetical protein [Candidatus Diapherotrites archaeon]